MRRWPVPAFGDSYVCDIARPAVVEFFDGLTRKKTHFGGRHLTHKFIKNLHALLHKLFDDAIEHSKAESNPAHKVRIEGGENSVERVVPTREDVVKTFAHLGVTHRVLFFAGAVTGLRRGELLGLCWPDLNLETGLMSVRHNLQRIKKIRLADDSHQGVERIGSSGLALVKPAQVQEVCPRR